MIISLYKTNNTTSIFKRKTNKFKMSAIIISVSLTVILFIYFKSIWVQILDVGPEDERKSYNNKMLWVNMDKIDVTNNKHKKWSNKILINEAPNKLGCYINMEPKEMTKENVLEHLEKFNMMFKHPVKEAYFKNKPNSVVKKFLNEKDVKIYTKTFRRTIK